MQRLTDEFGLVRICVWMGKIFVQMHVLTELNLLGGFCRESTRYLLIKSDKQTN